MRARLEAPCVRYLREQLTHEKEQVLQEALEKMESAASNNDG